MKNRGEPRFVSEFPSYFSGGGGCALRVTGAHRWRGKWWGGGGVRGFSWGRGTRGPKRGRGGGLPGSGRGRGSGGGSGGRFVGGEQLGAQVAEEGGPFEHEGGGGGGAGDAWAGLGVLDGVAFVMA